MKLPTPNNDAYLSAKPFPFCVIDGAFDKEELLQVLSRWPKNHERYSNSGDKYEASKGTTMSEENLDGGITAFIKHHFMSQQFISFLEALTGVKGIVVDCNKWGLHELFSGGFLKPHLDYTINKKTGLQLRINAILYLNEHWREEYGGNLHLYEEGSKKPSISIAPLFNRLVIFTMDAESPAWHGHPDPLNTPEGISRKSIAFNYFSVPQNTTRRSKFVKGVHQPSVEEFKGGRLMIFPSLAHNVLILKRPRIEMQAVLIYYSNHVKGDPKQAPSLFGPIIHQEPEVSASLTALVLLSQVGLSRRRGGIGP